MTRVSRLLGPVVVAGLALVLASCGAGSSRPPTTASLERPRGADETRLALPWSERREAYQTELRERGPAPFTYVGGAAPDGAVEVRYPSGDLELLAWLAIPAGATEAPAPALVYFHGAFSLEPRDFEQVRPFLDAGWVVMTPSLRGENGNPGDFELLYGEVDDAAAAIRWLAGRPEVDASRIYTLGHSAGGAISALIALVPDLPVRETASIGGIYVPETFARWQRMKTQSDLIRFDPTLRLETHARVLGPNVCEMKRPHLAIYGVEDRWFIDNVAEVAELARPCEAPFESLEVAGDHMGSVEPAVQAWLGRLQAH